ncbi:hypothetical protein C8Q75DRAFT_731597 [Abortiporus biennis]|nr:hypothetical protein C8Q75DRAFT_731597 [Abortiporus biennis]
MSLKTFLQGSSKLSISSSILETRSASSQFKSRAQTQTRSVSSSPYGRTHVWKKRDHVLPKPFVPEYPQLVVKSDGSTFTHYTTSPRSVIRLTRDTSNNPVWNPEAYLASSLEEDESAGRLGRFSRKFADIGAGEEGQEVDWMSGVQDDGDLQKMQAQATAILSKLPKDKKKK